MVWLSGMQGTQHHRQPSGGATSLCAPSPQAASSPVCSQVLSSRRLVPCNLSMVRAPHSMAHASSMNKVSQAWLALCDSCPTPTPETPHPPRLSCHAPCQGWYPPSILLWHHCYLGLPRASPSHTPTPQGDRGIGEVPYVHAKAGSSRKHEC